MMWCTTSGQGPGVSVWCVCVFVLVRLTLYMPIENHVHNLMSNYETEICSYFTNLIHLNIYIYSKYFPQHFHYLYLKLKQRSKKHVSNYNFCLYHPNDNMEFYTSKSPPMHHTIHMLNICCPNLPPNMSKNRRQHQIK